MFIISKQLNGPVLKSLKSSCLGQNREKKIGLVGPGPKFQFPFWAWPGSDLNFNWAGLGPNYFLYFGPGRDRSNADWAVPGLKN